EEAVAVADMDRADIEQRIQDANEELSNAEEGEQRRLAEGKVGVLQEMLGAAR
ncbi:MAG: F0F1 ATP synthase subunit epsilon, partial [Rhodospirillaceae bacterium]|nr:F0F1 ATP synthase subunit epsilon [Rhodospirillaceae bacterium]